MIKKVLILSPHTDDAELGAGGTIARFIEEGKEILWVVFSAAEDSLPENLPKDTLAQEFISVTQKLGLPEESIIIKRYRVRHLPEKRQEVLEELVRIRNQFKPDLVIGPSLNDYHQDHTVIANEMVRAFKTSASIICYELPWNHVTFNTQVFMKLERRHVEKKLELLQCYRSQVLKGRHYLSKDFIFGLATTRGVQIREEFAETFEVVRWIL